MERKMKCDIFVFSAQPTLSLAFSSRRHWSHWKRQLWGDALRPRKKKNKASGELRLPSLANAVPPNTSKGLFLNSLNHRDILELRKSQRCLRWLARFAIAATIRGSPCLVPKIALQFLDLWYPERRLASFQHGKQLVWRSLSHLLLSSFGGRLAGQ